MHKFVLSFLLIGMTCGLCDKAQAATEGRKKDRPAIKHTIKERKKSIEEQELIEEQESIEEKKARMEKEREQMEKIREQMEKRKKEIQEMKEEMKERIQKEIIQKEFKMK